MLELGKAPRWAVVVCSLLLGVLMVGFTANTVKAEQEAIHRIIAAVSGQWSAGTGIDGSTWQEQMDMEIKWFDEIYDLHKENFVITESLPFSELADISRINYLYENSEVFRNMCVMENGAFTIPGGGMISPEFIHRTAVMVDSDEVLTLDIDYNLINGRMAVILADPEGTVVYEGNMNMVYKASRTIEGKPGLWSVIRVYDGAELRIDDVNIVLRQEERETTEKSYDEAADNEAIKRMYNSGTWGDYIERLLPKMSPEAVDIVVDIYLERHLFPGITTAEGAEKVAKTIKNALEYMTEDARNNANKRIEEY